MFSGRLSRRKLLIRSALLLATSRLCGIETSQAAGKGRPIVVRVHSPRASKAWDYQASAPWNHTVEPRTPQEYESTRFRPDRYFDFIDPITLYDMLAKGLCSLTGEMSEKNAWLALLQNYRETDKITIKINLNNASYNERITTNRMDQSVHMINAIVKSLSESLDVPLDTITVADPSRWIHPEIIKRKCRFPQINWVDSSSKDLWDRHEAVVFTKDQPVRPHNRPDLPEKGRFYLASSYTETDHILNVCLLKNHGCGVTAAMKNHFGAIPPPFPKFLHNGLGTKSYIADLNNTPSIRNKVRINICEAVFGNWHNNVWCPRPWITFPGGTPNSLFLGTDPVAFDSVLLQHISDEVAARGSEVDNWVRQAVKDHQFLHYAMEYHRLGIHEHKPFHQIDYRQLHLT